MRLASIDLVTIIRASPETCFDLSRDVDLHARSMHDSGERIIAGKMSGMLGPGEEVTWQARHFGVTHQHHSRITGYDRPRYFRDTMAEGRFRRFDHDQYFEPFDGGTRMRDVIRFESPVGLIGSIVNRLFLTRYLAGLIQKRNELIRAQTERSARSSPDVGPGHGPATGDALVSVHSLAERGR